MKTAERKTACQEAEINEERKSKIRLYWEDQERRGVPKGIIHNMRAVLR